MSVTYSISVIGGDLRQHEFVKYTARKGFIVAYHGLPNTIDEAVYYDDLDDLFFDTRILLLPIPYYSQNGYINMKLCNRSLKIEEIIDRVHHDTVIVLGKANRSFIDKAKDRNLKYLDLVTNERFAILNSVPTAEGAIYAAIREMQKTIKNSNSLVLGYGRIGKEISKLLSVMGSNVSVEARKEKDLAWIEATGYTAVNITELDDYLCNQDLIINTIPHLILDESRLSKMWKKTVIIDVASKPGGTDFIAAKKLGIKACIEPALPGRLFPETAGKIIYDVIGNILV